MTTEEQRVLANRLRQHVLEMTSKAGTSHIGTNYSMIELLTVLYTDILRITPQTVQDVNRDRFILSKGHGAASLYAILAEREFFPLEWLDNFGMNGSNLAGHVTRTNIPGLEVSTGSLGHGLSIGQGMAIAGKLDSLAYRVFVLLSDGECDEGSTWEPILFAGHRKLDNLVAIVDYNKIQSLGRVEEVMDLEPFADKWTSFGWAVREIDGHNIEAIRAALQEIPYQTSKPTCIIAHTVKGKGVDFMEDQLLWHYRTARDEEYELAKQQLDTNLEPSTKSQSI